MAKKAVRRVRRRRKAKKAVVRKAVRRRRVRKAAVRMGEERSVMSMMRDAATFTRKYMKADNVVNIAIVALPLITWEYRWALAVGLGAFAARHSVDCRLCDDDAHAGLTRPEDRPGIGERSRAQHVEEEIVGELVVGAGIGRELIGARLLVGIDEARPSAAPARAAHATAPADPAHPHRPSQHQPRRAPLHQPCRRPPHPPQPPPPAGPRHPPPHHRLRRDRQPRATTRRVARASQPQPSRRP